MLIVNNIDLISSKSKLNIAQIKTYCEQVVSSEQKLLGELQVNFVTDEELLKINRSTLNHDYYTDIISFDYSVGNILHGDLFISVDRVLENAAQLSLPFDNELLRVLAHGILHLCGFNDKSDEELKLMRSKEDEKIKLFHVKHLLL